MSNRAIIVTGAGSGLGEGIARMFANNGFVVFAGVYLNDHIDAWKVANIVNVVPVLLDVTSEKSISDFFDSFENYGDFQLAALINNAGISINIPLEIVDINILQKHFEVNSLGMVRVMQKAIPYLRKSKGRVINIGSMSSEVGFIFSGGYCASKAALHRFSETFAFELYKWGIRSSIIEPGPIKTPIWQRIIEESEKNFLSLKDTGLYREQFQNYVEHIKVEEKNADNAEAVYRTVWKVFLAKNPRRRYLVGWRPRLIYFTLTLLPQRLFMKLFQM